MNIASERRQNAIEHLRDSTALQTIEWFADIDSTNQHARRMITAGDSRLPALLVADRQTAGRGRSDRVWWSPDGCLMFSLVIDASQMHTEPAIWSQLSLVAGVAAAKAAEGLVPPSLTARGAASGCIELKWPNDLYMSGRKLAGILVEAIPLPSSATAQPPATGSRPDVPSPLSPLPGLPRMAFVIGIGLNVAVDFSQAPDEVRQRACSLSPPIQSSTTQSSTTQSSLAQSSVAQTSVRIEVALVMIIEQLFEELDRWRAGDQSWWHAWNDRNLLAGRTVHLRLAGGQELVGLCEGIDLAGRLLVRDMGGVHEIQSADVVGWN